MSGIKTFLFTDLEGSTRSWEVNPETMRGAMARHDALLRSAVEGRRGRVVKTTGDGLHAVFDSPADAIAAALDGQLAIGAEPWPEAIRPFRVRMGLNSGESQAREGDFYGASVNRAARIMSAAHGGQILVAGAVALLVRDTLPGHASLRDLGEHALRDLVSTEQLFQLCHPGLAADFPPIKTLTAVKHNLPGQLTSFVGRERELVQILEALGSARLLTLLGPGGTGKTRLALQAAAEAAGQFPDGAWLIELAPLTDPERIPFLLAGVLHVQDQPGRSMQDALVDALRSKEMLLILDNIEHMVRACAGLAETLLKNCPKLTILATGREPLLIGGETTLQILSLALPAAAGTPDLAELEASESVRLFVDRLRQAVPDFELSAANAPAVAEIVRRLDGIPLALELAAARIRMMSVEQIAARLNDRFRLLTGGHRTALPRQQTLRALIDWSWNLLDDNEKTLFRRLSVFAGGWDLAAAEAVGGFDGLDVFTGVEALVNKSLILVDRSGGAEFRYGRLETIRQYGHDRLLESGEDETIREQHAGYFLSFAEEAARHFTGADALDWYKQLIVEIDNLRTALDWSLANRPAAALRMCALLLERDSFWLKAGEAIDWLERALARARIMTDDEKAETHGADLLSLLTGAGVYHGLRGDSAASYRLLNEAIRMGRETGPSRTLAYALAVRLLVSVALMEPAFMLEAEEGIEFCRSQGYLPELFWLLLTVGRFQLLAGDREKGYGQLAEGIRMARELGSPIFTALADDMEARTSYRMGRLEEGHVLAEKAAASFDQWGDFRRAAIVRSDTAHYLRREGRLDEALAMYGRTIPAWRELGHLAAVAHQLESAGYLHLAAGDLPRSARLLGAAEALRSRIGEPRYDREEQVEFEEAMAELERQLGEAARDALVAGGARMTMDAAVAEALRMEE